ncbi:MAG: M3 family metallopeptidase [Novosphingobium sp.]|nr:M3 family metallopeptidase [Novosphingobium sp.]
MSFRHLLLAATSAFSFASFPTMTLAADPAAPDVPAGEPAAKPAAKADAGAVFAHESALPFHAPDFAHITDADYQPAIEAGMAAQQAEVAAIADNPEPPTFDNTLAALERSGQELNRALAAFYAVVGANTNDTLDAVEKAVSPRLAAHADAIYLNPKLFARIKALYAMRAALPAHSEEARLLDVTYEHFVNAGAELGAQDKETLKSLNEQLSTLGTEFSQKLTEATKQAALVADTREELAGLSDAEIDAAAKEAKERGLEGKYVLTLINTTQQPQLASLTNRETRRRLYEASVTRTSRGDAGDTRAIIAKMAELRAQKATLLGYPDYASFAMYDRMVKNPADALDFMGKLVTPLADKQLAEAGELDAAIAADGGDFTVRPWDWDYYAEKVRKAKYDLDESTVKPYFEMTRVLEDGVFYAANVMYGLTFKKRTDIPVYQPDVTTYTVYDKDGSELGLFYFDPFARPNKQGGAWMGNFVEQSRLMGTRPVVYNVLNIPKAAEGEPQLVSWDNVVTMFHEFGHALHGLFADQEYPSVSGTNTARDFVEFPSQFNENFASQPSILSHYAKHYQTGETIPDALMEKIDRASKFNQGYALGEVVAAALLDMKWHALKAGQTVPDADTFEKAALDSLALRVNLVPPRYYSTYFRHIWDNGYAAGYYSYLWTEMIAHDAFAYLMAHGGLTREAGDTFRAGILSRGNTMDYAEMYRAYAGRDPQIDAMVEARGLGSDGE